MAELYISRFCVSFLVVQVQVLSEFCFYNIIGKDLLKINSELKGSISLD